MERDIWDKAADTVLERLCIVLSTYSSATGASWLDGIRQTGDTNSIIGMAYYYIDHHQWSDIERALIANMDQCVALGAQYTQLLIDEALNPSTIEPHALPELDVAFG